MGYPIATAAKTNKIHKLLLLAYFLDIKILLFYINMKANCSKFCFLEIKHNKQKTQTTKQNRKTEKISSTVFIHKCQLLPLINYRVSVVSYFLHLLFLELFSYVKVCWYSAYTVKVKKKKESWHNIIVNKTLTQCEEIPERHRLKEYWYSLPRYPVPDWHWWKAVRTAWGFNEFSPAMVSKPAVTHGLLLPRKRNW